MKEKKKEEKKMQTDGDVDPMEEVNLQQLSPFEGCLF